MDALRGGALLEEAHHLGPALRLYSLTPFPVLSLYFLYTDGMLAS